MRKELGSIIMRLDRAMQLLFKMDNLRGAVHMARVTWATATACG
jgi:hypothetical protein